MSNYFWPSLRLVIGLGVLALVSHVSAQILAVFENSHEAELLMIFFSIAVIFSFSFIIFYLAKGTFLPSFVVAIFVGIAAKPFLAPVVENQLVLGVLVGFGATLILFGGGLETKFDNFKRAFTKIMMLSFVGLGLTALLLSLSIVTIDDFVSSPVAVTTAVLLGAILASTDPAAIILLLKRLRFKNPTTKDIIVSEGAVTDVTGTLLTVSFLALIGAGLVGSSVLNSYSEVFSPANADLLFKQVVFGVAFGILGYALLHALTKFKTNHIREYDADSAFFLFIPVIIFTLAIAFGGSGYLAAFLAGLLFKVNDNLHETERFFNQTIDGFFTPTIFLLLGALVDLPALIHYAPLGLLLAALFMFVIRPVVVFISLVPMNLLHDEQIAFKDMLFIAFVREIAVIPAVLLVTVAALNLPNTEALIPLGMWIILATLIVEPPLTPWVAKKLDVASLIPDPDQDIAAHAKSGVILASRSLTWKKRLPFVADWAVKHKIPSVTLLLCLEDKYTTAKATKIALEAQETMDKLNLKIQRQGHTPLNFTVEVSEGLLQDNIERISRAQDNIVAIFVGRKMLDYRLDEIKRLSVPFYFLR